MRTAKFGELTTARNLKVVPGPPEGRNVDRSEGEKAAENILVSETGEEKETRLLEAHQRNWA